MVYGANNRNLKSHNLSAILLTLLHETTSSRAHLAQTLNVSNATITNLINDLSEQGFVAESGVTRNDGNVGRPQRELHLVPNARFAVGIHFDVGKVYIGLTNLLGDIIALKQFEHPLERDWKPILQQIHVLVRDLVDSTGIPQDHIVGIGVAASGLVDVEQGNNVIAPNLKWYDVPMRSYLSERLNLPVMVDNNVRAMALGEAMFGQAQDARAMAFIYGRMGVGAGLVVDGQLFRGAGAGAGEIGHTQFVIAKNDEKIGSLPLPQRLETLISEPTIIELANALKNRTDLTLDDIFALARANDADIRQLLQERAFYAGISLANLINIFNPEMIILGGIFDDGQDILLPTIEATMRDHAFARLGADVVLKTTQFGHHAGVIGSAALALNTFFYRPQQQIRL